MTILIGIIVGYLAYIIVGGIVNVWIDDQLGGRLFSHLRGTIGEPMGLHIWPVNLWLFYKNKY